MADNDINALLDDSAEASNESFTQLRNAYKQLSAEAKELRGFRDDAAPKLKQYAVKDAGFDPESPQASALLKLHEGDLTPEALSETAKQYGLAPTQAAPKQELTPEERQAIDSTQRGQQTAAVGGPAEPPQTMAARLSAAEQKANETGDWSDWDRLQIQATT